MPTMAEIRAWLSSHRQWAWWIVVLLAALAALWMLYVLFGMMGSYTQSLFTPPPPPLGADGATPSNFPVELLFAEFALLAAAGRQYYKGQMGWSTLLLLLMFIGVLFLGLENTQRVGHNLGGVLVSLTGGSIATMWITAIVLLVFAYLRHKASKTDAVAWLVLAVVILFLGVSNVGTVGNNLGESLVEMTTKSATVHEEPRKEAGHTDTDPVTTDDLLGIFGEEPGAKPQQNDADAFLEDHPKIKELVNLAAENPLVAVLVMIGIGIFVKGWLKNDSAKGAILASNIAGVIAVIFALVVGLTFAFSENSTEATQRLKDMRDAIPAAIKAFSGGREVDSSKDEISAQWSQKTKDGTLPVGNWSKTVEMPPGYSVDFIGGCGDVWEAQYRFYSKTWTPFPCGSWPNMSHFRFRVLKPGLEKLPYTLRKG